MFHFLERIITTIEISIWTHVYHSTNPISECPKGYLGDCSQRCISPAYGEDCQSLCNCADGYYCHFANGCTLLNENKIKYQTPSKIYIHTSCKTCHLSIHILKILNCLCTQQTKTAAVAQSVGAFDSHAKCTIPSCDRPKS